MRRWLINDGWFQIISKNSIFGRDSTVTASITPTTREPSVIAELYTPILTYDLRNKYGVSPNKNRVCSIYGNPNISEKKKEKDTKFKIILKSSFLSYCK
jgi:hypothetical protein